MVGSDDRREEEMQATSSAQRRSDPRIRRPGRRRQPGQTEAAPCRPLDSANVHRIALVAALRSCLDAAAGTSHVHASDETLRALHACVRYYARAARARDESIDDILAGISVILAEVAPDHDVHPAIVAAMTAWAREAYYQ